MFQKHAYANAHLTRFILYELVLSKFSARDLIFSKKYMTAWHGLYSVERENIERQDITIV